jgi:hypothetical protein
MEPAQRSLIARYVEIRAAAKADRREETPTERAELLAIEEKLNLTPEQIYTAFAELYPEA